MTLWAVVDDDDVNVKTRQCVRVGTSAAGSVYVPVKSFVYELNGNMLVCCYNTYNFIFVTLITNRLSLNTLNISQHVDLWNEVCRYGVSYFFKHGVNLKIKLFI